MMKARSIHYNHQSGIVTAEPHPAGEKHTVAEDAESLDMAAGDDVRVRVDSGLCHVESLSSQPLLVRNEPDGRVFVRTARHPPEVDTSPK